MESFETAANMELSTNFSQVVFQEIPNSYVSNVALTCCYTLTAAIQPNPRDWVGIFKVGWSTTKDYHTFVWVEPSLDLIGLETVRKQVLFTAYYLPKDDSAFYQFCYVDSNGQVRGASTPFCFKTPGEQSTDCSLENDLLVIITQEKVEQREREKEELVMELGQLKEQNETLRNALKEQQQEIDHLKLSNEELYQADGNTENKQENARKHEELTQNTKLMDDSHRGQEEQVGKSEREKEELTMELGQLKEQNETLTCALKELQQEIDHLKESKKELVQLVSKLERQQQNTREHEELAKNAKSLDESQRGQESLTPICEKYERALIKIKQLKKEREVLRGKVEVQSVEIAQLSPRLKESERESHRLKAHIQLLQVDLQSSKKEKKCSALKEQQQEESKEELLQVVSKLERQQQNTREHEELAQNAKSMDESQRGQESLTTICEKYERALITIKQLKKEREELKGKIEVQSVEIAQLSPRLKESEQESHKLKDHIQLLQVDLQSSEKEKLSAALHRVCGVTHDLQDLKTENKALRRSLSEQEQQPLQMVDSDWKEQYQALLGQLEEAQTQLHKELQASNNTRKRAEQAERELEELKECMESTAMTSDQTKQERSKLEMQLSELNEIIEEKENMAEIAKVEKEELSRENQDLKRDIERLRKEFDDVQAAPVPMQYPNPYGSSTDPTPNKEQQQEADSLHFGNPYETPGTATNLEEERVPGSRPGRGEGTDVKLNCYLSHSCPWSVVTAMSPSLASPRTSWSCTNTATERAPSAPSSVTEWSRLYMKTTSTAMRCRDATSSQTGELFVS
ncbi:tax1-binding protein 1 homolog B-like isoform X2 [Salvelinus namaycush]|uniref:Tax1-binding protein 1 homolog B-like isoform X2 n=1 Tax=Salvelinus namaycush TaxID=8040 RepID=A0A8U0TWR9_SALNM|nr:tax1-binding protein 1 homolog B-like isoform X2 [Salvelinus namaycush]